MYTLDITGHDASGKPCVNRFGGLYQSAQDASRAGHRHAAGRFHFKPETLWVRDEENKVVSCENFADPPYVVTITSSTGDRYNYRCGGASDQEALIYAGKIVEAKAGDADPSATVEVTKNGERIGLISTVADMLGAQDS